MSPDLAQAAEDFLAVRNRLFGIANQILRNRAEAEDIVQEAWLRWQMCDRDAVADPPAFLATTTTRLCINVVQSARVRHEICFGPRSPEPMDPHADPHRGVEQSEALQSAAVTLLERLSPTERAAYVLREAFDYSYTEIAAIVRVTEQNARQLVSRARKHLASGRREPASRAEQRRLHSALTVAAQTGDLSALENVLSEDMALAA